MDTELETQDLDVLARVGDRPRDEQRATLAAWLSDANAVPGSPGLRRIDGGTVVSVDALLAALRSLDGAAAEAAPAARPGGGWRQAFGRRRHRAAGLRVLLRRHRRDDDDDPPPCPAVAGLPVPIAGFGVAV